MPKRHRPKTIRAHLVTLMATLAAPLLLVLAYSIYRGARADERDARSDAQSLAQVASAAVGQFVVDTRAILERLAAQPLVLDIDRRDCDPSIPLLTTLYPQFVDVVVADPSGAILCSAVTRTSGAGPRESGWAREALDRPGLVTSRPYFDPDLRAWVVVFAVAPERSTTTGVGAVGVAVPLERFQGMLGRSHVPPRTGLAILDRSGTFVANNVAPTTWLGKSGAGVEIVDLALARPEGQVTARGVDGEPRLYSFLTVPGTDWRVCAGIPVDLAYAAQRENLQRSLAVAAWCVVVAAWLAFEVGRRIEGPLRSLRATARAVQAGDHQARAAGLGPVEIADVAASFNEMLDAREAAEAEVRASEERFRLFVDGVRDHAVFLLDPVGRTVHWNAGAERATGYGADEALGRPLETLWLEDGPGAQGPAAALERAARDGRSLCEAWLARRDGSRAWTAFALNALRDERGTLRGFAVVTRDLSDARRAEAEHRRLEEELRQKEMMSLMGSLVASVAHEARNPLFGISATLDAFEARSGDRERERPYLDVLRREVDRLSRLMTDLLDYGRPLTLDRTAGSLAEAVSRATRECRAIAERVGATVDRRLDPDLPAVLVDRERIIQVFRNLIENALLHSSRGGTVTITAAAEPDGRSVRCTVTDEGPGFRAEDLGHVFEPFFSRRPKGTGLGLSIVKRLVDEHEGRVEVANRSSGGAAVTVRLPTAVLAASGIGSRA